MQIWCFFFGTLKLGFCPIITIITSGFHFSCREYIFLKFFFSLIFVTFVVYMLCHQKMDLSVLCILAFEWALHGNRYALNNRKAFYWLWNRSYISFPLISLPISEHYMLAELHLYIELMGFFFSFFCCFLFLSWMIAVFLFSLERFHHLACCACEYTTNTHFSHFFVCVCFVMRLKQQNKIARMLIFFSSTSTMQKSQKPNNFSPLRNIA